jgi:hypothetical protein
MMLNWVPTYMHDAFGMSNNLIGFYNAMAYAGQFASGMIASGLADLMFSKGSKRRKQGRAQMFLTELFLFHSSASCDTEVVDVDFQFQRMCFPCADYLLA